MLSIQRRSNSKNTGAKLFDRVPYIILKLSLNERGENRRIKYLIFLALSTVRTWQFLTKLVATRSEA